jgi:hypothetical protein
MKTLFLILLAGSLAATALAADNEPKPTPKPKAESGAKAEAAARAEAERKSDVLNDRLRRDAQGDQKDRARGTGASSGATQSTPSAPSGVDTSR